MATVVTTTTTSEKSKGNPLVSIIMLVAGGVGVLLGLISLIYAAVGADLAYQGSGVVDLQAKCAKTFSTYSDDTYYSYDSGECNKDPYGMSTPHPSFSYGKIRTMQMCEFNQSFVGCSAESYRETFALTSELGLSCTVAAAIFCMIGSFPVVLNGVFGLLNKQTPAQVTAGVGIGFAIPSCCAITICAVIMIAMSALAEVLNEFGDWAKDTLNEHGTGLCSPECRASRDGTIDLFGHIRNYFDVLRNINVAMIILMLVEAILACISCATWKKQYTTVATTHQPVVVHGGVIPAQVVQPVVIANTAPVVQPTVVKTEAPVVQTQVVVDPSVPKTEAAL